MSSRLGDTLVEAWTGVRIRRLRSALTMAGIGVGVAVMVAVVGLSASSKASLVARLDALGTNLLRVSPGSTFFGQEASLPAEAAAMIRRIGPVESASAVTELAATVRRSDLIPDLETGGLRVVAAEAELRRTLELVLARGAFLDGREHLPGAVLGATAARRLGIADLAGAPQVYVDGTWLAVVGILEPTPLTPEIDRSVLVGRPFAAERLAADLAPSTVYVRAQPQAMEVVSAVLARTASPFAPNEVSVTRPSDALEARAAVDESLTRLVFILGGVVVLVAGAGVMNVMLTAVLERRSEIGLRRALGATRAAVGAQFLAESGLLTATGGLVGIALGALATVVGARRSGWLVDLPPQVAVAALGGAVCLGALAGLQPAWRAARLDPAEAVRGR